MSNTFKIARLAVAISAVTAITACSSDSDNDIDVDPETPVTAQVASDYCTLAANPSTNFEETLVDLVEDGDTVNYAYYEDSDSAPEYGNVVIETNTGNFTYTPANANARGFSDTFKYAVYKDGQKLDSAEVTLIYGAARIMPVGDSITFGVTRYSGPTGDLPTSPTAIGYRKALLERLENAGYAVDFVGPMSAGQNAGLSDTDHAGFPGWRADQLATGNTGSVTNAGFGDISDWLDNHNADALLVHAGTNDLYQGNSAADASSNMGTLLTQINQWHSANNYPMSVLAAQIIPPNPSGSAGLPAKVEDFNSQTAINIGSTYVNSSSPDFKVHVVDHHTGFNPVTDLTNIAIDTAGLHPNTSGYEKIAETWYQALVSTGTVNKCD